MYPDFFSYDLWKAIREVNKMSIIGVYVLLHGTQGTWWYMVIYQSVYRELFFFDFIDCLSILGSIYKNI